MSAAAIQENAALFIERRADFNALITDSFPSQ
jgi:hypothetical protein